ncbi:hypothetical protein [Shewanella pealeana]|uniref:PKD domain containing protein n=1 Tax=Shewanella pealeana (strain ATCC 700345 / ANG-SQ1) TaxID=398579 RepID=A8H9C5_SHEPA|nr:hypothetical protein [Shewanella pealeana]ABV89162.1 hypothetical protein Spea_3852 [Shewanella pealeana ATCC 700345]
MISSYRTALFLFTSLLLTGCPSDSSTPDNIPPEIQLLVEKTEYQEGEVISLAALASDKDGDDFQVSWLLVDAPSQVTLEKLSDYEVRLVVTAPLEQGVLVTVQVSVSDGSSEVSLQTQISITQNLAPQISYDADAYSFQLGEDLSFPVTITDSDSDDLYILWELKDSPEGYDISSSDGGVQLTAPIYIEESVSLTAVLQVSDGYNAQTKEFLVIIKPNLVPLITAETESYSFQLGEDLSFPVTVSDSDSDSLEISWTLKDSADGFGVSSSNGVVQLTTPSSIAESVSLTVQLQVSDGYNALEKEFAITLLPRDIVEVTLVYPPASAITDARSTVIRGISSFELSSLMVNGEAVTSSDNFLNWTVTLPIAELETLEITPETSVLPTQTLEYKNFERTIKHTKPFILENESLTAFGDHVYLINDSSKQIIQHNLVTDERSIIFQATADFDFEPEQAVVDEASNRLVIAGTLETAVETYGLTVVALDLASFTTTVLFQDLRYEAFNSIVFNGDNNKLLIPDWHSDGTIFEIDLTTGIKTQLYAAKSDFGIEVDRGYELQYHNGDLLWGDVGTPKLYKIDQVNDQMSIIWQGSDYQADIDSLDLSLRFYKDFIYDEQGNKLTLIIDEGAITFDLNLQIVESFADFRNLISPFEEVESAHVAGRDVHIWDEGVQMLITYNLDSGAFVASGNDSVNINLSRYPRSIALSSDEKSLYYSSDESPAMYRFPIDATDNSQLETVFDLSVNNDIDEQPNFYFEQYVTVNPVESGFYLTKDYDAGGLYFFEFDTLDIINIALIEDMQSEFAIDFDKNLAFTLTENNYYDGENWIDELFWKKINLDSGEVTDFSSNLDYIGTEFEYDRIDSLTLSPDGEALIVEMDDNLVQISTGDGSLTWFSKDKLMPNLSSNSIESLIWAGNELIAINGNANSGLYKVDQSTGEYTELSGKFVGSGATPFDFDTGVYSGALQQFFIVDYDLEAIYAIDELTGERLIIHK